MSLSRPRILLVEDHSDTRALVERVLEGEYHVAPAAGAKEALRLLGSGAFRYEMPDLFLLDIRLKEGRDGAELLRVFRDLEPTKEVPAVALTTYASAANRKALFEVGFDGHMSKPFRKAELFGAIGEALSARQTQR